MLRKSSIFFNGANWIALNLLQTSDSSTGTLKLSDGGNTVTLDNSMAVAGASTLQSPVVIESTLTTTGNITSGGSINAGGNNISAGSINSGIVTVGTETVITPDRVKSTTLEGYG